jgi:hypothetical protein
MPAVCAEREAKLQSSGLPEYHDWFWRKGMTPVAGVA